MALSIVGFSSALPYGWKHAGTVLVGILCVAFPHCVSADDYLSPIGGSGGGRFQSRCAGDELLVGFELRAADDVDAIRPLCATALGPADVGATSETGWHGGSGGRSVKMTCPSSKPIVFGMDVTAEGVDTVIVNNILLKCGLANNTNNTFPWTHSVFEYAWFSAPRIEQSSDHYYFFTVFGDEPSKAFGSQDCRDGLVAVGVHGRSGIWLDAIGLICGEAPVGNVQVPPPPPKKTIAQQATKTGITATSQTAAASVGIARSSTQANRTTAIGIMSVGQTTMPVVPAPVVGAPDVPQPVVFNPPLLEDNAQLWACVDSAARDADAGACSGIESAQAYCRLRDAQSGPDLVIANAQPDVPVRAVNGDTCADGDACRVVSYLQCDR